MIQNPVTVIRGVKVSIRNGVLATDVIVALSQLQAKQRHPKYTTLQLQLLAALLQSLPS